MCIATILLDIRQCESLLHSRALTIFVVLKHTIWENLLHLVSDLFNFLIVFYVTDPPKEPWRMLLQVTQHSSSFLSSGINLKARHFWLLFVTLKILAHTAPETKLAAIANPIDFQLQQPGLDFRLITQLRQSHSEFFL